MAIEPKGHYSNFHLITPLCINNTGEFRMSAYIVVDTKINNESEYEEYKKLARPIAEKYGGVYRARGGKLDIRETDLWTPVRIVIIEFPDLKSAQSFLDSEEYAPVKPMRHKNADSTLFIVDGGVG